MKNSSVLETERLILRRFTEGDADAFFHIMADPQVSAFLPLFPPADAEEAGAVLKSLYLDKYKEQIGWHYAVCRKADGALIGCVDVSDDESRDLGYALGRKFWRQGYATEACRAVVDSLRKAGLPWVTATHDVRNLRSGQVMRRIGMRYRYSYREQWQPRNIPVIFRMYQLNLDGQDSRVLMTYWNRHLVHFIEPECS